MSSSWINFHTKLESRQPRISLLKEQPQLYTTRHLPLFVDKNVWLHWMETHQKGNHRTLLKKIQSNTILVLLNKIVCERQEIRTHTIAIEISTLVSNKKILPQASTTLTLIFVIAWYNRVRNKAKLICRLDYKELELHPTLK